jgi:adenosylmethionine-8-amino-7-oxononanoate aminotransferase
LACAAANATLDIFENESIIEKNLLKAAYMEQKLEKFKTLPNVKEVRRCGMICAVELEGYMPSERIGMQVYLYGLKHGVLLRPLGHVVYFMPPYIITHEEIDVMMDTAFDAIVSLVRA